MAATNSYQTVEVDDDQEHTLIDGKHVPGNWFEKSDAPAIWNLIWTENPTRYFLPVVALALLAKMTSAGAVTIFACNFFALVPLSKVLAESTEQLALRTNDVVAGLMKCVPALLPNLSNSCPVLQQHHG